MAKSSRKKKAPVEKKPVTWLRALIIVAMGFWIYAPVLCGDWIWDDNLLVADNAQLRDMAGLGRIWISVPISDYWPLSWTVLWLEWHVWGAHPLGYHLVSLALHLFSGFLIWRLLERLGLREGWLGGLLFVVHPLAVESVAWISEIKNTLSLPFFLLACHAYLDSEEDKKHGGYFRSLGYYLAAMLSKTSTVMLPLVLLLYGWSKSGKIGWPEVKKIIPYLIIALPLGLITVHFQNNDRVLHSFQPDGLFDRLSVAVIAVGFYLGKFLWPTNLLPIYPGWTADSASILTAVVLPLLALLILVACARREKGRRFVWFGFGFFLINLLPVVGLVRMKYQGVSWVADHFMYLPIIGLIGLAVAGWQRLQVQAATTLRPLEAGILAVIMAVLAFGSHSYAALFTDRETLWTYTLQFNPQAAPAHSDLSIISMQKGRIAEAIEHAETAVRLSPEFVTAHINLGKAYNKAGRLAEAEGQFRIVVKLDPENPVAHNNLAGVLVQSGNYAEALEQFNLAVKYRPDQPELLAGRGELKRIMGDWDGAFADLDQAATLGPETSGAYLSRGVLRQAKGDTTGALSDLRRFRDLAPKDSNADYAALWIWIIHVEQGQKSDADQELSDALNTHWNAQPGDSVSGAARFLLGQITEPDYFGNAFLAEKHKDQGRLCEALYYDGIKRLLTGNKDAAAVKFRSCLATGKVDFFESTLAQGELNAHGSR